MNKEIVITAAVYGVLAVITGAFGAHSFKSKAGCRAAGSLAYGRAISVLSYVCLAVFINLKSGR